ncbi:unnamed protein product [Rotaria sordida]|uniref:Uncharacterized protein n=1 Tax=Rotaria sordida TaxID=392033 RepID=A0A819IF94_9BILA|nr:unnamed protein product [Rotaria sordida]CAF3915544.1 unnamed protein product [Rotaria sordida]
MKPLLEEALNEPTFWKRPFLQVKDHYNDIGKCLRRISVDNRFVHRCTTILEVESKLYFAQESKWQMRRTVTDLRKQEQLQNDFCISLTIFMICSSHSTPRFEQNALTSNNLSASLRLAHTRLYQPVLEHTCTLENHIQKVLSLSEQLIEKQDMVQATTDIAKNVRRIKHIDTQTLTREEREENIPQQ